MSSSKKVLLTGARDSNLSLIQTRQSIQRLRQMLPQLTFEIMPMSSPGDRDRQTELRFSEADFFTRDLDDAVLSSQLDCAFHSAKDLPSKLREGLDMFYLPWHEDPRDALVYPAGRKVPAAPVIGVSSYRREAYAEQLFPDGRTLSIRGNIEERIRQLDAGKYDVLIMAAAGLIRLGLSNRISERISVKELQPPPAQGWIAISYRKGDQRFNELRKLFVHRAIFAGAGIGSSENTTVGVVAAIKDCDVCVHDALCPHDLLDFLPEHAMAIDVGKRKGKHSRKQSEICEILIDYIRKGRKVLRLKGGDPGLFGRLAEETASLDEFQLPYVVMPGVSSLAVATASTGLLLTRRGVSRGFTVSTPRQAGCEQLEWFSAAERDDFTQAYFMATSEVAELTANMLAQGYPESLPVAIIYHAGYPDCQIVTGVLSDIVDKLPDNVLPGIILAGKTADKRFLYKNHGSLAGMRVLFAGARTLANKAKSAILGFGGIPLILPMIEVRPKKDVDVESLLSADYLLTPSPSCAEILLEALRSARIDLRRMPKLAVCGRGTAAVFNRVGIIPEVCPNQNFGTKGLIEALKNKLNSRDKVVRLCSDQATAQLSEALRAFSGKVVDLEFYSNQRINYRDLPDFDAILFCSSSSVNAFLENFSVQALSGKIVCAIGTPTENELNKLKLDAETIKASEADVEEMVQALAARICGDKLQGIM